MSRITSYNVCYTKLLRLNIVRTLQTNRKVRSQMLADTLGVTVRTIQKDINERLRAFPIETDGRGCYWMSETRLDRASLLDDEEEVVLMLALELSYNFV